MGRHLGCLRQKEPNNLNGIKVTDTSADLLQTDKPDISIDEGSSKKNEQQVTVTHSSSEKTPALVDVPYIDINKMLESLSGDEEAVHMLLEVFIQDHSNDGVKLCQLLNADKEQAQRVVHSLKGVSGSLGAMPLSSISGDIELLIKEKQNVPESKLNKLKDILEQTILLQSVFSKVKRYKNANRLILL